MILGVLCFFVPSFLPLSIISFLGYVCGVSGCPKLHSSGKFLGFKLVSRKSNTQLSKQVWTGLLEFGYGNDTHRPWEVVLLKLSKSQWRGTGAIGFKTSNEGHEAIMVWTPRMVRMTCYDACSYPTIDAAISKKGLRLRDQHCRCFCIFIKECSEWNIDSILL